MTPNASWDQCKALAEKNDEPTDYQALIAYGHSPAKAAEIILDAKRGDDFCRKWIAQVRRGQS